MLLYAFYRPQAIVEGIGRRRSHRRRLAAPHRGRASFITLLVISGIVLLPLSRRQQDDDLQRRSRAIPQGPRSRRFARRRPGSEPQRQSAGGDAAQGGRRRTATRRSWRPAPAAERKRRIIATPSCRSTCFRPCAMSPCFGANAQPNVPAREDRSGAATKAWRTEAAARKSQAAGWFLSVSGLILGAW